MTGNFVSEHVYRQSVIFLPGDADLGGRAGGFALLRRLEQAAGAHYGALGLGQETALRHDCFWALARTEMKVDAPVPVGTELYMDSWAGRQAHGLFWLHYRLTEGNGRILLRAASVWVLIDVNTRSFTKNRGWIGSRGGWSRPGELPTTLRRPEMPALLPLSVRRTVRPGEADANGHLNNAQYLRWAEELLQPEYRARHTLRELWVEYKKELPLGQTAELQYLQDGDTVYVRGTAGEKESFTMRCFYDPI